MYVGFITTNLSMIVAWKSCKYDNLYSNLLRYSHNRIILNDKYNLSLFSNVYFLTNFKKTKVTANKDPGKCHSKARGSKVVVVDSNGNDRVLICVRSSGEFIWRALDSK